MNVSHVKSHFKSNMLRLHKSTSLSVLITLSILFLARFASATPLFSMQAAERCDTCHEEPDRSNPKWVEENYKISERKCRLTCGACHVNPSGGMLRNDSGFIYGTKTLPRKTVIPDDVQDGLNTIKNNKFLTLGGDFRFLLLSREGSKTNPIFFPMQADIYANANVGRHVAFLSQMGMERGGNSAVREVVGMLKEFPFNSYLKVGKFVPPYGHRLEDHTAFIRDKLGLNHSKPDAYVSGYEIGAEPVLLYARFSHFNSDVTPQTGATVKTLRGTSGEAGWRGLWLHLGASYIDINDFETTSTTIINRRAYGVFGALRLKWVPYLKRLTYLFEYDFRRDSISSSGPDRDTDANITFNELDYRISKGANIKLRYETYEPDKGASDNIERKRYLMGVDMYPYPFTELNIQYRINKEEPETDNNEFLLFTHIWF